MGARPILASIAAKAVEYGGLVVLIGGVFLLVMGGGAAAGLDSARPALTLAAAALLAVGFEPARRGVRQLANRVTYGHRSSPLEAVSRLAVQMGRDRDPVELLEELSAVVRAGTGARKVVVWLRIDGSWVPAVGSPDHGEEAPLTDGGADLPRPQGTGLTVPIQHGDEVLGAITASKSGPGSLLPLEHRLVQDLAAHAGIVTQTLHLRETLRRRLEAARQQHRELVASRIQVVATQDEERRRLERDLHDSCQQGLVVLGGRLGLASLLARQDPAAARAVLHEAAADVDRVASALGRLTKDAAPTPAPVVDGIGAALRAETASLPTAVEIDDGLACRYPRDIEATVYFCCMEAIQNAGKHAGGSRIRVRLHASSGWLRCSVRDDGVGFDVRRDHAGTGLRNIRERLGPWQGRLTIHSSPTGTEILVEIPVPDRVGS